MTSNKHQELQQRYEKNIQCLCQQLQQYHKQLEQLQGELDSTRSRLSSSCRDQDDLKRSISQKDEAIVCLEGKVAGLRFDLREKEIQFKRQRDCLQERACAQQDQLQQKDSALTVCQNEVRHHLNTMEEVKANLESDIKQKDSLLCQMRENLERVFGDLKCKTDENCRLGRSNIDLKEKLAHSNNQCREAESRIAILQDKIPFLESQFSKEKQQALAEMDAFERKLQQTLNDLCCASGDVRKLKRALQEKHDEMVALFTEKETLSRDLQREKDERSILSDRVETMEGDNKELCRLMQSKIKNLKEVEQVLCLREEELAQCRCCVEELSAKIRQLSTSVGDVHGDDLGEQLARCREALAKCDQERTELENKLQYAIKEMEKLANEVKRLNCELEGANNEICHKDNLIEDMEQTFRRSKDDTETRMCKADAQMDKYEKEIKDKTHQLAELELKCCRFQEVIDEKNQEIEALDQKLSRAIMELETIYSQVKELQESRQCLQASHNDERAHNAQLVDEVRKNKEQLQVYQKDVTELKRDACVSYRNLETLNQEKCEFQRVLQEQEGEIHRLSDERCCLRNKLTSIQCRLEEETDLLSNKLAETKNRLDCEVGQLRSRLCQLEDTNSSLSQKLASKERLLTQQEKGHGQKEEALARETSLLQAKLADKDYQIQASRDCLTIKDSEIMRLKLRLCSMDRCNNSQTNNYCSQLPGSDALRCLDADQGSCCPKKKRAKSCPGRKCCRQ